MSSGPLLPLALDRARPLGRQLEQRVRELVRGGGLPLGSRLPSTRALAVDLGVSRGVVVDAYGQLAAEGYIELRRGAPPLVATSAQEAEAVAYDFDVPIAGLPFNLRPDLPDLGLFPRAEWLRACRQALATAANHDLAYGEPFGAIRLRARLAPFLVRTRGVVGTADRVG